jgi:hypothetical protein
VYAPLLTTQEDWGSCQSGVATELLESLGFLNKTLGEAIDNVKDGVRLEAPDAAMFAGIEAKPRAYEAAGHENNVVNHCVEMMEKWIGEPCRLLGAPTLGGPGRSWAVGCICGGAAILTRPFASVGQAERLIAECNAPEPSGLPSSDGDISCT